MVGRHKGDDSEYRGKELSKIRLNHMLETWLSSCSVLKRKRTSSLLLPLKQNTGWKATFQNSIVGPAEIFDRLKKYLLILFTTFFWHLWIFCLVFESVAEKKVGLTNPPFSFSSRSTKFYPRYSFYFVSLLA